MPFRYSHTGMKKVTPYEHPFDDMLVRIFCQFAAHYITYKIPLSAGKAGKKFNWTYSEYNCFGKLAKFGMIRKLKNKKTGKASNVYKLTALGEKFYLGEAVAPSYVVTIAGEVIGQEHEAWSTHYGDMPEDKYITELGMDWKSHNEWANERKLTARTSLRI